MTPSATLAGLDGTERDVFAARLTRWLPDLLDGLTTLYGPDQGLSTAARLSPGRHGLRRALARAARRLDLDRMVNPTWVQDPSRIGYAGYTERFAGDLRGVEDRIGYLPARASTTSTSCHCSPPRG